MDIGTSLNCWVSGFLLYLVITSFQDWPICNHRVTILPTRAVAVAQLVEQSLPMPEIRGSNPPTKFIFYQLY